MNNNSYAKYVEESYGWLHVGRRALIAKVLENHVKEKNRDLSILEVGAGVGQNIPSLSPFGSVDVMEIEELGLIELVKRSDIRQIFAEGIPCKLNLKYDIIGAFDVIEHIEDDRESVQWICDHLKPGGLFIATVPAFQWFFSEHDSALGHHRRYSSGQFKDLVPNGFEVLSESYFNFFLFPIAVMSRIVWSVKNSFLGRGGSIQKQPIVTEGMLSSLLLKVFLKEVELLRPMTKWPFGLSFYACFRKL